MYAKVPEEMKEHVLDALKRARMISYLKCFPAALLVFSALGALVFFTKGHLLLEQVQEDLHLSNVQLAAVAFGGMALIVAVVLALIIWQEYRAIRCEEYLYCRPCNAVDNYDNGVCPICKTALHEKSVFIYTSYSNEKKIIERIGLEVCQEE